MFIDDFTGIENIPGIEDIEILHLSDNRLASIPSHAFASCTHLSKLYIRHNPLFKISAHAFAGLKHLFQLSLNNNQLQSIIDPDTFAGLDYVHDLYLNNNSMHTFNPKALAALPQLNKLLLYYNQLNPEKITHIEAELKARDKELTFFFTEPQLIPSASIAIVDTPLKKRDREEISSGSELINNNEKEARTAHSD